MVKKRSNIPQYTYRQTSKRQEKVIYRRIALVSLATLVILLIIYFWGLSFINLLGILGEKKTSTTTTAASSFDLPLQKPQLTPLQNPTNTPKIDISGTTTASVKVNLVLNGTSVSEVTAGADGSFQFTGVILKDGLNQIQVTATDKTGQSETASASVVLDKTPPTLVVTSPSDGANYAENTKSVVVSGTTSDPDGIVYVNSIQVTLEPKTGSFTFNLPISAGQLQITIQAFDAAGNSVTQTRTINVAGSPPSSP